MQCFLWKDNFASIWFKFFKTSFRSYFRNLNSSDLEIASFPMIVDVDIWVNFSLKLTTSESEIFLDICL